MRLSNRINEVAESATLSASQKARDLKAQGIDIISLTVGESDFNTPDYISDEAVNAIKNHTGDHYSNVNGLPELRQAIVDAHERSTGVKYDPSEVFVGAGAKNVLYGLTQVLIDAGDEIILPVPFWGTFAEQIKLAEGVPVFVEGDVNHQYKITVDDLEAVRTDKTTGILINTPSNPTGATYTKDELLAIGNWAVRHDLFIIADEIYLHLVYNGNESISFSALPDEIKERTIIVDGVSKTYAMTGWRLGHALGDKKVMAALSKFASQSTGNPTGISQYAAISAYNNEAGEVEEMRKSFEQRLNKAYDLMNEIPGFKLPHKPQGAFYLFPDVRGAAEMTGYETVDDFCLALIEEAHVVTVVGSSFGAPSCIRISYATDEATFAEGMKRIKKFVEERSQ